MVDNKSFMKQVHEYENLTANVLNADMKMCKIFRLMFFLKYFYDLGVITKIN